MVDSVLGGYLYEYVQSKSNIGMFIGLPVTRICGKINSF